MKTDIQLPKHTQVQVKDIEGRLCVADMNGNQIADTGKVGNNYATAYANRIATALNEYDALKKKTELNDELVKALKECYDLIRTIEPKWDDPKNNNGHSEQQYNAYKLLKLAQL